MGKTLKKIGSGCVVNFVGHSYDYFKFEPKKTLIYFTYFFFNASAKLGT